MLLSRFYLPLPMLPLSIHDNDDPPRICPGQVPSVPGALLAMSPNVPLTPRSITAVCSLPEEHGNHIEGCTSVL